MNVSIGIIKNNSLPKFTKYILLEEKDVSPLFEIYSA